MEGIGADLGKPWRQAYSQSRVAAIPQTHGDLKQRRIPVQSLDAGQLLSELRNLLLPPAMQTRFRPLHCSGKTAHALTGSAVAPACMLRGVIELAVLQTVSPWVLRLMWCVRRAPHGRIHDMHCTGRVWEGCRPASRGKPARQRSNVREGHVENVLNRDALVLSSEP